MKKVTLFLGKPLFWFLIVSVFLSLIWSRGFLLAFGEEGLHLYDPLRSFRLFSNPWLETLTGISTPFLLPRVTFYGFAGLFQLIGIPSWLAQVIINSILIANGLFWMYKLMPLLFTKQRKRVYFYSAFFYLFNLYTMSQILTRSLYTQIFLWSFLPLFLYLWIKWIMSGKIKYLSWFCISSFLFSETFGIIASVAVLWGPALLFLLLFIIRERKERVKILVRSFLCIFLWVLTNLWWIYPLIRMSNGGFATFTSLNPNFVSLQGVSKSFPSSQVVLLRQKYFFGETWPWYSFYSHPIVYLVSISVVLIVFYGIIKNRKEKNWLFLALFLFTGWFISKGSNPPFGEQFYYFIFAKFPFLTIFRNPYEKGGLVFLLPYAAFFGLGIDSIYRAIKKRKKLFIFLLTFVVLVFLVWPMWTGNLFISTARVRIPSYYQKADEFLQEQGSSRLLQLPYNKWDGVTYNWGFVGLDASTYLFDSPSVSAISRFDIFDNVYNRLPQFLANHYFSNILRVMGISNIVLRKDIKYGTYYGVDDLGSTQKFIDSWRGVSFQKGIGDLDIYSVKDPLGMAWSPVNILKVNSHDEMLSRLTNPKFDIKKDAFVISTQTALDYEFPKNVVPPQIKVEKVSASFYKVRIINARSAFVLVLNQTYDDLWEAKVGINVFPKHLVVNGYANGWIIDKEGDYEIDLVFKIWPWE